MCCRILILSIDTWVSKLNWGSANEIRFLSKRHVVSKEKAIQDFQWRIDAQTNALTLLLTASNW